MARGAQGEPICQRTVRQQGDESDLVTGGRWSFTGRACEGCRKDENDCGAEAKFYQKYQPVTEAQKRFGMGVTPSMHRKLEQYL